MPQKGIHPLLNAVRVVMRNGASFQIQTTMRRTQPYVLQIDSTTNPTYTGETGGLSMEDERMQKIMSRFGGFLAEDEPSSEAGAAPAGSSSSGNKQAAPVKGGKKKK